MSEKPILFSTEMVNAILEGRKTQTRLVIKPQPVFVENSGRWMWKEFVDASRPWWSYAQDANALKYRPGDTLWVRETWGTGIEYAGVKPSDLPHVAKIYYRTDGEGQSGLDQWRPSIFMPRWASRITLQITNVRVERLHDISETDCIAEGITDNGDGVGVLNHKYGMQKTLYAELWDTINGKKHPWQSNPWVWVVEFEVMK